MYATCCPAHCTASWHEPTQRVPSDRPSSHCGRFKRCQRSMASSSPLTTCRLLRLAMTGACAIATSGSTAAGSGMSSPVINADACMLNRWTPGELLDAGWAAGRWTQLQPKQVHDILQTDVNLVRKDVAWQLSQKCVCTTSHPNPSRSTGIDRTFSQLESFKIGGFDFAVSVENT